MFEGGTSKTHSIIKKKIKNERDDLKKIVNFITDFSIAYLKKQIISGVDIVKIFESWAGLLGKRIIMILLLNQTKKYKEK